MTEDEAKTKLCPAAQMELSCIGSACMAWRYSNRTSMHDRTLWVDSPNSNADDAYAAYIKDFPLEGYCGLAGKSS